MLKQLIFILWILYINSKLIAQQNKSPTEVVQENLDFYNQRNLEGFMSSFSDSIVLYNFGKSEPIAEGKEAIRNLYKGLFDASPKLHSTILHRSIIGNKVIDHESIVGRKGSDVPIELVMIYEVSVDEIVRMTVIRE
jgi:hypothetical protein